MNLDKLNSLTKYPSIPTYHELGDRGRVKPDAPPQVSFEGESVIVTEKVDGSCSRVVFLPDGDWFIGAREEFLTARGDRVPNTQLGIVEVLRPIAERLHLEDTTIMHDGHALVMFAEVYGISGAGASWKQYTTTGRGACRIFDLAWCPLVKLALDREAIASWRDHGGQSFFREEGIVFFAETNGLEPTPRRSVAETLPTAPNDVRVWLEQYSRSLCAREPEAPARSEGVVVRTVSRSKIAKIRFENYQPEPERRPRKSRKRRRKI